MGKSVCLKRFFCLLVTAALLAGAPASARTIWGYSEGLALAQEGNLYGYADTAGKVVIPVQYDTALSFSLGMAKVGKEGRLGVIRQDGRYLIEMEYGTLDHIDAGVYIAQKGNKWGVVSILPFPDGKGGQTNLLYPLEYDNIQITRSGGTDVLAFEKDGSRTTLPLFRLPGLMLEKQVPSARFPLVRGRLPDFSDVSPRDWYDLWADLAYNLGLMEGVGGSRFAPKQVLTVAEALQLAAQMESRYTGDSFHTHSGSSGGAWYTPAVDYCIASGIIRSGEFSSYTRAVTRAEVARIFAATSLAREMPAINSLAQVKAAVPDVKAGDYAADAIYSLYTKGVLTGTSSNLAFQPAGSFTRAEAAAIVSRMARAEQRITLF